MTSAQRETYGDGLDEHLHPDMWAVKPHYYGAAFYNWPYTYGLLFGIGLYAQFVEDPDRFRAGYDDLLSATGLGTAAELASRFGIDVADEAFWVASLDVLRAPHRRLRARSPPEDPRRTGVGCPADDRPAASSPRARRSSPSCSTSRPAPSEVLLALAHLQAEGKLRMHDAVIVAKNADGNTRIVETVDTTPAKGAIAGSWFGLLGSLLVGGPAALAVILGGAAAGALYGKLVDRGLEDDWVRSMADWIDPDSSALLLLVESGFDPEVVEELAPLRGHRRGRLHDAAGRAPGPRSRRP